MNDQNNVILKPNQRIINTYSEEQKDRYVNDYLKISNECTISRFAKDHNLEFQTLYKWIRQRTSNIKHVEPVNIKSMIKDEENKLITIVINGVEIKTDEIGIKVIIEAIIK